MRRLVKSAALVAGLGAAAVILHRSGILRPPVLGVAPAAAEVTVLPTPLPDAAGPAAAPAVSDPSVGGATGPAADAVRRALIGALGAASGSGVVVQPADPMAPGAGNDAEVDPWSAADLTRDEIKQRIDSARITEQTRQELMQAYDDAGSDKVKLQAVLDALRLATPQ